MLAFDFLIPTYNSNQEGAGKTGKDRKDGALPFRSVTDSVLDDLSLGNRADLLEEFLKLAGTKASSQLLNKYRPAISLIFSQRGRAGLPGVLCLAPRAGRSSSRRR